MHKFIFTAAVAFALAAPASATDYLAERLELTPGEFTRHEMVLIMMAEDKDAEIERIYRNRAALREAVGRGESSPVAVTRAVSD